MKGIIKIYEYLTSHHWILIGVMGVLLAFFVFCASQLTYQENIFDFLPQEKEYTESMQVYSSLSEASRIVIIFEGNNPDSITQAIDFFSELCPEAISAMDIDSYVSRLQYVHTHMPYFLTDEAYQKLSLICDSASDTLSKLLVHDKQLLSLPGSSFMSSSIASDPLGLIPISKGLVGQYAGAQSSFTASNGYLMSRDQRRGFAFYDSPYGSTETKENAKLLDTLSSHISSVTQQFPTLNIRLLGAPVIAVGNARQIKKDSVLAISLSLICILALLLYSFPRRRDILYIFISVIFGWLIGMSVLFLFVGTISVIVLGIGAIFIGISINYPLHILVHQRYTLSVKQTLAEVSSPLLIGNITTVGAFLALIPLHSPCLRQLGIFASSMLLGTIFFSIFVLPHLLSPTPAIVREICFPFVRQVSTRIHHPFYRKLLISCSVVVFCLIAVFGIIRDYPMFDANLSHINYMTAQQKEDFAWFESLSPNTDEPKFLAISAKEELQQREVRWEEFWQTHNADSLAARLKAESERLGFRDDVFDPFIDIITQPISKVNYEDPHALASVWPGKFDTEQMNTLVSQNLTANFDYLGIVCSCIVLLFLCLSFKSLWIGLIAFLPMLFSWVLIIALMQLFNLQFNIVNVILATFIFGQGDDYTIFVVEGLLYEEKYGKKILNQYKQSIILSALVMLVAIGVLIFAKHPAMHSLGAVTLIGMACVVVMAFVIPPVLFRIYQYLKSKIV